MGKVLSNVLRERLRMRRRRLRGGGKGDEDGQPINKADIQVMYGLIHNLASSYQYFPDI